MRRYSYNEVNFKLPVIRYNTPKQRYVLLIQSVQIQILLNNSMIVVIFKCLFIILISEKNSC